MREVLFTFSDFSGRSIVAGSGVSGLISAQVDAPWPDALDVILGTNGFVATELPRVAPDIVSTETLQLADVLKSSWEWRRWFEEAGGDE